MEHGGFFVVVLIIGMVAVLIVKSATPDCARLRTVEGVAPFPFSW